MTYRHALARHLAAALVAGLAMAVLDAVATARAGHVGVGHVLWLCLGLYAWPTVGLGLAAGLVAGAADQSFGDGALRRLVRRLGREPELDRAVTAGIASAALVLALLCPTIAFLAMKLVAPVERKTVGALLLGGVVVALLPLFALAALPVHRAARRLAWLVPRLGPIAAAVVLIAAAAVALVAAAGFYVSHKLDWRALNLGVYGIVAGFAACWLGWRALWSGPLAARAARIPRRGALVAGAAGLALILPLVSLRGSPSPAVAAALAEQSKAARVLVAVGRALIDRDHDGYSPFLGGPDCDDHDARVHPDAKEIPGNGIDDNCLGGDRPAEPVDPNAPPASHATSTTAPDHPAAPGFSGNLVFIAIDTLRADRIGQTGYRRAGKSLTPRIDQLAQESVYFTRTYAQAPNTPRSFPSFFSSRYPGRVEVDKSFQNYPNPQPGNDFLMESLQAAGLHTAGVASHFYFDRAPGFVQGFDEFDNAGALDIAASNHDSAAPRIVPRAIAKLGELGKAGKRFALFVHLFEPHSTYMEHDGFPITAHGSEALVEKYDGEIAFVDGYVGQLLDAIDQDGLRDQTLVVLLSDHGEAFGVHKVAGQAMFFHGQTLYDELLRVPLMIRLPGAKPHRVDDVAMLLDVAPTIVDVLGARPLGGAQGRSLAPYLAGQTLPPRPAFAQLLPAPAWNHDGVALVSEDGKQKLIYRISDHLFERYDLAADPEERRNLWGQDAAVDTHLKDQLTRFIEVDLAP